MRSVFLSVILFSSAAVFAHTATVVEVVPGDVSFVKLDNGEVQFLDNGKAMLAVGDTVETMNSGFDLRDSKYVPTVVKEKDFATTMFERMREDSKWRSQCYNRAHIWSYEEHNRSGTKLSKTYIFFTNRYIRNYRYKWWFHVAPSTVVEENGEQKEVVLDITFFDKPEYLADWAIHFMKSERACASVTKYSDYENNQETEDCYLIRAPMYFWQPLDLETYEQTGVEKTEFNPDEVKRAYRQAF